jgi:fructose-1-phosphate kinase PfkB-like protein
VVTCGEQGVILATRDETVLLPNSPLQTALSTLSLTAGIASGLASGLGFRLALRRAMGFKSTSGN